MQELAERLPHEDITPSLHSHQYRRNGSFDFQAAWVVLLVHGENPIYLGPVQLRHFIIEGAEVKDLGHPPLVVQPYLVLRAALVQPLGEKTRSPQR